MKTVQKRAWKEIDLKKISRNIDKIKKHTGRKFMACVKGNCYGFGAREISLYIQKKVDFFGVATTMEALELRDAGIKKPVMVLGPVLPGDVQALIERDVRITVFNDILLKAAQKAAMKTGKKALVHIKVDTGLGRIGVLPEKAEEFVGKVAKSKGVITEGIFTHFATAEQADKTYAKKQIRQFNAVLEKISRFNIPLSHIANSAAVVNLPETYENFDMIRIGVLFLGVYPAKHLAKKLPLECAIKGFCRVHSIKTVPGGTPLSYGLSYATKRKSEIATAGIGYADGLRRALSNQFYLIKNAKKLDIVGNICMDQTLLDATGKNIKTGDTLQVFGDNLEIEQMAKICKTAVPDILCGFSSPRMKNIYKK